MSKIYGQLERAQLENLSSNPVGAALAPKGRIWYDTATGVVKFSDGSTVKSILHAGSTQIVNADVNASAAIARSKLASGTANRVLVNDGSGVLSDAAAITASRALVSDANGIPTHSSVTATELGYLSGATSNIQNQINTALSSGVYSQITLYRTGGNVANSGSGETTLFTTTLSSNQLSAVGDQLIIEGGFMGGASVTSPVLKFYYGSSSLTLPMGLAANVWSRFSATITKTAANTQFVFVECWDFDAVSNVNLHGDFRTWNETDASTNVCKMTGQDNASNHIYGKYFSVQYVPART